MTYIAPLEWIGPSLVGKMAFATPTVGEKWHTDPLWNMLDRICIGENVFGPTVEWVVPPLVGRILLWQ